jgi:hypothetical protein
MGKISDRKKGLLTAELDSFFRGDRDSRLLRLYESCNAHRKGRGGRFRKGPFALYWLFRELGSRESVNQFIRRLNQVYEKLEAAGLEIDSTLKRYRKRGILEILMRSPELIAKLKKGKQLDVLEKEQRRFRNLPYSVQESAFWKLARMNAEDLARMKRELKGIRQWGALTGKLFDFLLEQKARGRDRVAQREIQRRFTKRISELKPILDGMAFDRVIVWDRKKKAVSLNGYNPKDRRKFVWLVASSWPRSPFEPYLEKGKTYRVKNFRGYVVEEWVKTGAAALC